MPTREDVLNDPGFYKKPLDFQEKVLLAVDPKFSALNSDQRMQALVSLNHHGMFLNEAGAKAESLQKDVAAAAKTGEGLGGVKFDPNMSPAEIAAVNKMLQTGGSLVPKTQQGFDLGSIPERVFSGLLNVPGAVAGMITEPIAAYQQLRDKPVPPPPKTLEELKARRAAMPPLLPQVGTALKEAGKGVVENLSLGLIPFAPATNEEDAARRALGGTIGGTAAFGGLSSLGKRLVAPAVARLGAGAIMGGTKPLSEGDIGGAIEGATTGAGAAGVAELGAKAVAPAVRRLNQERQTLRAQSQEMGGATGIMKSYLKNQSEAVVPNELIGVPGTKSEPISVGRGADILSDFAGIAKEATRQKLSEQYDRFQAAAPKDAKVSDPSSAMLAGLLQEVDPAVQTTAMRKIASIGNTLQKEKGAAGYDASEFAGLGQSAREAIAAAMGDVANEGATFQRLTKTYQNLNAINATDRPTERLLTIAKKAVEADINKFDKIAPQAVSGWHRWRQDYANEFGARFGNDAPLGALTKEEFGRPSIPPEQRLNAMGKMEPDQVNNIYQTLRRAPQGHEAVDAVQAAHLQRLNEMVLDADGSPNAKKILAQIAEDPKDSATTRQWQALLGPKRFAGMKILADTLRDAGYTGINPEGRGVLGPMEAFHVLRGGLMIGNPLSASYHFLTAGIMRLSPSLFDKMISTRVGAKLLAAGLMEDPATPRGKILSERVAKMAEDLGEPIDVTPPADMLKLSAPVINQGPPPPNPQIPPPGPGNRPKPIIPPFPDAGIGSQNPAAKSAQVFKEAALQKAAALKSPIEAQQLKRSLRAKEAKSAGKFSEEDQAVSNLYDRFIKGKEQPSTLEHEALRELMRDKTAAPALKDMAGAVLNKYPVPMIKLLEKLTPPPGAKVLPVSPEVPVEPTAPRRVNQEELRKALAPKGKSEADIPDPIPLMNRITKEGNKIFVPTNLLAEIKAKYGAKATDWFSDDARKAPQTLDEATGLFAENYGIEDSYNAFRDYLDNAFDARKVQPRMTTQRRKGNPKPKKESK